MRLGLLKLYLESGNGSGLAKVVLESGNETGFAKALIQLMEAYIHIQ